jgi:hypothetical protein
MEDLEGCADLINTPRREVRYGTPRRARTKTTR